MRTRSRQYPIHKAAARCKRLLDAGRRESVDEVLELLREVYLVKEKIGDEIVERWGPLTKEKKDLIKELKLDKYIPTH